MTNNSILSMHETLEYVRFAHQIKVHPGIAQYPRDDYNMNLVQNVNDICVRAMIVLVSS